MKEKIRSFLEKQFLIEFDESFLEDSDLFKEGVMDSFGYVQLCRFLETEFSIVFTEQDMTNNIMVSLSRIHASVQRKLDQKSSP
jgi:D-alanine--poly(phosphoribitol) ligase subunit 2